ncbi:MAG: Fe-S cluster assembly ATPase SufC [Acidimicrobiales bacterium]
MTTGELRIEGLRAEAAGREILRGVTLLVRSGEVHAVMGPNGSGKSTLAHVLMGRPGYRVLGGTVTLDGVDLLALPTWQRARAGLFLGMQHPIEVPGVSLLASLTAARTTRSGDENEGAAPPDVARQLTAEADRIGFDHRLLERPLNVDLSGGERKRNETVQLGVLRPRFAVLDEIDSGLDVDALAAVGRRVQEATKEWGLGVLAVTHFARLLEVLVPDVVHVLTDGKVVATGGPELAGLVDQAGYAAYR